MNMVTIKGTEEPRNSAFQGTCGFYALLREMPYCQYMHQKQQTVKQIFGGGREFRLNGV